VTLANNNLSIFNGGLLIQSARYHDFLSYVALYNNTITQQTDPSWVAITSTLPLYYLNDSAVQSLPVNPPVIYYSNNIFDNTLPINNIYAPVSNLPVKIAAYNQTALEPTGLMDAIELPLCTPSQEQLVVRAKRGFKHVPTVMLDPEGPAARVTEKDLELIVC
jgi:hypothetical protein